LRDAESALEKAQYHRDTVRVEFAAALSADGWRVSQAITSPGAGWLMEHTASMRIAPLDELATELA
jgi:hypothetical protein